MDVIIHLHNTSLMHTAFFYWYQSQQHPNPPIYVRAQFVAFTRPDCWEQWKDACIPVVQFLEFFWMTLTDFEWLLNQLQEELQQDLLGLGNPLTVESQVAVGLYCLAHDVCYMTIGHIFNIGKETADKATGRFVNAVLKKLRLQSFRCALRFWCL
jgi:hypothetical protein